MTTLFREDDEQPDREVTLGIGSLLSIFFGIVLVCGVFFGFGYSMGRRNVHSSAPAAASKKPPAPAAAPDNDTSPGLAETTEAHKVAPPERNTPSGAIDDSRTNAKALHSTPPSAAAASATESRDNSTPHAAVKSALAANDAEKPVRPSHSTAAPASPSPATLAAAPVDHRPATSGKPRAGIGASGPPPAAPVDAEPTPGHPLMVQIAAVSRQEDAEVLAGALRKRGFAPQVKSGTADKFFHVQVGPFADKAQAESMKQHLLADGYNAILK